MSITVAREHKNGAIEEVRPMPEPQPERPDSPISMESSLRQHLSEDPELQGLTLYEKKAVLINRELDSHGMSRYQWCIWVLCGFGYFLDLLWAQAFGLALVAIIPEFGLYGENAARSGDLSTSFNAGLTAGAFVWGFLVDIIGRWWAFNGTCFIAAVFGLCIGASNSYPTLLVLTAFCGFGVGGNIPIDTTICLEFLPQNRRFLLAILSLFQPLGVIVASALSYAFIPPHSCTTKVMCTPENQGNCCDKDSNYGWRYLMFTLGAISIFIFLLRFLAFRFRESPKYLLYRGHDKQAAKVLQQIAEFNHRQPVITLDHFEALSDDDVSVASESSNNGKRLVVGGGAQQEKLSWSDKLRLEGMRMGKLFATWNTAYMTLLVWVTYMFDYLSFSAAGAYIPTILSVKGAQLEVSISETYRNYIIIYTPGIVAALLGGLLYHVPGVGRKWGMIGSSVLQGVSLFLFAAAHTEAAYVGFSLLEYFMQTVFNAILYGWTPEIFSAPIRGTACGLASFFGRIFGIIAPLISAHIWASYGSDTSNPAYGDGVLYFAGAAVWVASVCILLMPNKRMGAQSY